MAVEGYAEKGMYSQALDIIIQREKPYEPQSYYVSDLSWIRAQIGEPTQSRKLLAQFIELSKQEHIDPGAVAVDYIELGDKDQAFVWLERAFAAHSNFMSSLKVWPGIRPGAQRPAFCGPRAPRQANPIVAHR